MKLLLDTHTFIWFSIKDKKLSKRAKTALEAASNSLFLSVASIWEMQIKIALGRMRFPAPLPAVLQIAVRDAGIEVLQIELPHIFALENLPQAPHDPFDRLLASQSLCENMPLVSADGVFESYPIKTIW